MTAAELQPRFAQPYDRAGWLETVSKTLPRTEIFARPQKIPLENARAESIVQLGKIHLADQRHVALLEVTVGERIDLLRNRVGLRQVAVRYVDQAEYHGVLAIFHQQGAKDYRFTFAAREAVLDESGQLVRRETPPRRYTYLLGPNESCRTAAERFGVLARRGAAAALKDVVEAFNVEKLNKEFFGDFRKAFKLVTDDILARNKTWERPEAERETQTLLSRLLFLYFIQRKGWLNRQRDYLATNFGRYDDQDPQGTSFYDKFLKSFFIKLSSEEAFFPNLDLGDLPFLNGGLFDDEMGALDGRGRIKIGNATFRRVFDDLLEAYNFTVREDTPLDQEVAVDPEMLGKIFESLVLELELSDTAGETSRHDTGSYYTPRPIVHYLCREGLRAWLQNCTPTIAAGSAQVDKLHELFAIDASDGIDEAERAKLDSLLTPDEARALLDRLDGFRACDPAVGSGAFLVGLLHELVNVHRLCETRARGKDPAESDAEWLYESKKRVIESVLYGVDIQQRAVEICKLRLWISLMVDYPLEVDPDNCALPDFRKALKKIAPLPNLDFKIRRANSLVEQIRGHPIKFPQAAAESRDFALSLNKLATAKHRFYEARRKKEKRLAQLDILDITAELAQYEFSTAKLKYGLLPNAKDAERVAELARAEAEMGKLQTQISAARAKAKKDKSAVDDDIERLARVFSDEAKPTFVWQLDFAEIFHRSAAITLSNTSDLLGEEQNSAPRARRQTLPDGFDLLLANPPYVRQESLSKFKEYFQSHYEAFDGTADLYTYFMEAGVRLLRDGGILSIIVSSSFLRASYGEALRRFLKSRAAVLRIVDFGGLPVFENAKDTYVCLPLLAKNTQPGRVEVCKIPSLAIQDLSAYVAANRFTIPHGRLTDEAWSLKSDAEAAVFEKIIRAGKPLGDYVERKFFRGVTTGLNEAFIIDTQTKQKLIASDAGSSQLIKPLVGGEDIRRWSFQQRDQWLIFTRRGIKIDDFPAIKAHLAQRREDLAPKKSKDAKRGRKPGRYEWFEIQDDVAYYQIFDGPKIIFPDIAKGPRFCLDREGHYLANTAYCLGSDSLYLLGILNSRLFWFAIANISIPFGVRAGEFRYRLIYQYMEKVPIIPINPADATAKVAHDRIVSLVDTILKLQAQKTAARTPAAATAVEQQIETADGEIDRLVYALYGLTKEEIKIVEDASK